MRQALSIAAAAIVMAANAAPAQTGPLNRRIDSLFATWNKPGSPGCAVGVAKDGRMIHLAGYGTADLGRNLPMTPRTVVYAGSVSKQFAAAAVALAVGQGKLSLDDDIRKYLPELPDHGTPITVRHLVHHTSGVRDYLTMLGLAGALADPMSEADFLALIARQKTLNFPVGTQYLYSNSGYVLLGLIVKRATGQSLRAFTDQHLFKPLGMTRTYFYDDHTKPHPFDEWAVGYHPKGTGYESGVFKAFDQVGDGGLYTTVEDLAKWSENFATGAVGGPAFLARMQTPGALADGKPLDYAFALRISDYNGLPTIGHGGAFMGYRANHLRFPGERLAIVALCNLGTISPEGLSNQIADLVLADRLQTALGQYVGDYHNDELPATFRVVARDGRLYVSGRGREVLAISRGKDGYQFDAGLGPGTLTFERTGPVVRSFVLELGRASGLRFVRR